MSDTECEAAATALQLESVDAAAFNRGAYYPPFCFYSGSTLYCNLDTSSTAACTDDLECLEEGRTTAVGIGERRRLSAG